MKKLKLPVIVVMLILSAYLVRGKFTHEPFNSELWKTANLNSEENMSLRWDMMNDLRNKHKLLGLTKDEIIKLLGTPEDSTKSEFRYYLGYSKTGINTGTLIITFNDKNVVLKLRVWQG